MYISFRRNRDVFLSQSILLLILLIIPALDGGVIKREISEIKTDGPEKHTLSLGILEDNSKIHDSIETHQTEPSKTPVPQLTTQNQTTTISPRIVNNLTQSLPSTHSNEVLTTTLPSQTERNFTSQAVNNTLQRSTDPPTDTLTEVQSSTPKDKSGNHTITVANTTTVESLSNNKKSDATQNSTTEQHRIIHGEKIEIESTNNDIETNEIKNTTTTVTTASGVTVNSTSNNGEKRGKEMLSENGENQTLANGATVGALLGMKDVHADTETDQLLGRFTTEFAVDMNAVKTAADWIRIVKDNEDLDPSHPSPKSANSIENTLESDGPKITDTTEAALDSENHVISVTEIHVPQNATTKSAVESTPKAIVLNIPTAATMTSSTTSPQQNVTVTNSQSISTTIAPLPSVAKTTSLPHDTDQGEVMNATQSSIAPPIETTTIGGGSEATTLVIPTSSQSPIMATSEKSLTVTDNSESLPNATSSSGTTQRITIDISTATEDDSKVVSEVTTATATTSSTPTTTKTVTKIQDVVSESSEVSSGDITTQSSADLEEATTLELSSTEDSTSEDSVSQAISTSQENTTDETTESNYVEIVSTTGGEGTEGSLETNSVDRIVASTTEKDSNENEITKASGIDTTLTTRITPTVATTEETTSEPKNMTKIVEYTTSPQLITTKQDQQYSVDPGVQFPSKPSDGSRDAVTTSSTNDGNVTDAVEGSVPNGTDYNVIIAISVSVVGIIALILLVGFLYVMRKRQKQLTYGQRCRPVSLDAYSLDNVSVFNSVRRKGAHRSSKKSYGNVAFDDPSLKHNVLTATALGKFAENKSAIYEEYKDVPQIIARADEVPQGCEDKNRYANVIPLPETRVLLQRLNDDEKTEYINANFVRGPKDLPNYYIACQAPLEKSVVDFWRMIWEQNSRVIVMATDLTENGIEKCSEYLPASMTLDNHTVYGDYQITLKNREVKEKYAVSTLNVKNMQTSTWREIIHLWYQWPETGVPADEASVIAMLLEARSYLKMSMAEQSDDGGDKPNGNLSESNGSLDKTKPSSKTTQGPLTVHCSPGTGRTGTMIACDIAIRSLETPKRSVDIPQIVYYVRRGRASAVQTKEQYEFIYRVAQVYATKITGPAIDN